MSISSNPINATRFAAALSGLSLASLHAKAAEIRNSILHLRLSNAQLDLFAQEGDVDCKDAMKENEVVLDRMRERINILRQEVEGRGARWVGWDEDGAVAEQVDGGARKETSTGDIPGLNGHADHVNGTGHAEVNGVPQHTANGTMSGRLTDEELARRIRGQLDATADEEEGIYL